MILRSVRVERMRRIVRPIEVRFDERLTIVAGPNEVGKSTLFSALEYAFFRRSNASGDAITRLEPWDREGLRPRIVVEFTYKGVEYTLEKDWAGKGSTRISTRDAAGTLTDFKIDGADEWLLGLFAAEGEKRTAQSLKARHVGLAHLLFAPQGRVLIRSVDPEKEDIALSSMTHGRLDALVGTATLAADETEIITRISKQRDEVWTAGGKQGEPKRKSRVASSQARERADSLAAELAQARDRLIEFHEKGEAFDSANGQLARTEELLKQEQENFDAILPRLTLASRARSGLDKAESKATAADNRNKDLTKRVNRINELDTQRRLISLNLVPKTEQRTAAVSALQAAENERTRVQAIVNAAKAPDAELEAASKAYDLCRTATLDSVTCDHLREAVAYVEDHDRALADLATQSLQQPPSQAQAAELAAKLQRRRDIASNLRNAETLVTLSAIAALDVERSGDKIVLAAGEIQEFSGANIDFTIPGVAKISARGPVRDVSELHGELAIIEEWLAGFSRRFGTIEYEAIVRQLSEAEGREREQSRLREEREKKLAGRELSELQAQITELETRLAKVAELGDISECEKRERALKAARAERIAAADAAFEQTETGLALAKKRDEETRQACEDVEKLINGIDIELQILLDNVDRDVLRDQLAEVGIAQRNAALALSEAETAYEPYRDIEDPSAKTAELKRTTDAYRKLVEEGRARVTELRTKFEELQGAGISARIASLEAELAAAEEAVRLAAIDEDARLLLHNTVQRVLEGRAAGLRQPIEQRVAPWYEKVTGQALTGIRLGQHHEIGSLRLADVARDISIEDLSAGAADQLGALLRLAFADLLADDEPLPVLLDDPLVNADSRRRSAMLDILREVSERTQIIVFTCRSEDYASSGGTITGLESA